MGTEPRSVGPLLARSDKRPDNFRAGERDFIEYRAACEGVAALAAIQ